MKFIEVKFSLPEDFTELLIAELLQEQYDSFAETEEGLLAYVEENVFNEETIRQISEKYKDQFDINYSFGPLEDKNWNEEWEKNFDPVIIDERCIIRADFHKIEKKYPLEVIINPKMSFGTGHHETTSMMVSLLLDLDLKNKHVMDAGCGTAILAIVASKQGAADVVAFDIEDWAYDNARENIKQNHIDNVYVSIGNVSTIHHLYQTYHVIVANINKNVLLAEIPTYAEKLEQKGLLLLSGFYENDIEDIDHVAGHCFLKQIKINTKNNWTSLVYEKNTT